MQRYVFLQSLLIMDIIQKALFLKDKVTTCDVFGTQILFFVLKNSDFFSPILATQQETSIFQRCLHSEQV